MKFPYSIISYVIYGDYDWDLDDLPFEVNDEDDYKEIHKKFEEYCKEHKIGKVYEEVTYTDLEKSYQDVFIVFTFDGKYYGFEYSWSPYCGIEFDFDNNLSEYEPYEKTVTDYKLKNEQIKSKDCGDS